MGRKKITIKPISDERNRHVTFNKRKSGLIKKAMELSILCNCQISLVIFNAENQLFEYCSTDPRFILQRYCQVAHLPHERLANADYSRFDKATRTKSKKGNQILNTNSNSLDNENSNESYSMSGHQMDVGALKPQDQLPLQFQGNPNYGGTSFAEPNMMQQQNQPLRFTGPSGMMGTSSQRIPAFAEGNMPFTPLTPNTIDEIVQQNSENANNIGNMQVKPDNTLGLSLHQLSQLGYEQASLEQQQLQQYQMQLQQQQKRKQLPTYEELGPEDDESPQTKKRKFAHNNLTIQVPSNRPQIPMRRMDGENDMLATSQLRQDQLQQYEAAASQLPKKQDEVPQLMVVPPPQLQSSGHSSDSTQNLTPLGTSSFSEYTTDKSPSATSPVSFSSPTTLNNIDWVKPKEVTKT